ncbi:hypothetical protein JXA40_06400 [bacterium]|nr:hypothetical protein [candidate division CSSED10-310 bacterium]
MRIDQWQSVLLGALLILTGTLKGLFCLGANPPWQAADEVTHFEATVLVARHYRADRAPIPDSELQHRILISMNQCDFYRHVGVPSPTGLPSGFHETPFLESSPSKLGRPSLYYWITGLPGEWYQSGLPETLMIARAINALFSILAAAVIFITAIYATRRSPVDSFIASGIVLFHPAYWHLGTAVTQQSWIVLISACAFFLAVSTVRTGPSTGLLLAWTAVLILAAATRWTLTVSLLVLLFTSVLLHSRPSRRNPNTGVRIAIFLGLSAAVAVVFALFFHAGFRDSLLQHEFNNLKSGFRLFQDLNPGKFCSRCSYLFKTFWAGFGWLTIPVPQTAFLIYGFLTLWIPASIALSMRQGGESARIATLSTVFILFLVGTAIIRAHAAEPAVQGRYMLPGLPALAVIGSTGLIGLKNRPALRKSVLAVLMILLPCADAVATIGGWVYSFRVLPVLGDPVFRAVSALKWTGRPLLNLYFDIGSKASEHFLKEGWYPNESAPQRWFHNEAGISVPLLPEAPFTVTVRILPYQPPGIQPRQLDISWNSEFVHSRKLLPGWNEVRFLIQPHQVGPSGNELRFYVPSAGSPYRRGDSMDRRRLSAGVDRIAVASVSADPLNLEFSRLTATRKGVRIHQPPDSGLTLKEGTRFSVTFDPESGSPVKISPQSPAYLTRTAMILSDPRIGYPIGVAFETYRQAYRDTSGCFPGLLQSTGIQELLFIFFLASILLPVPAAGILVFTIPSAGRRPAERASPGAVPDPGKS